MAVNLPDPPVKVPMTDDNGFMVMAWVLWFRSMFQRIGGTQALTNIELANLPALDLAALTARVTMCESNIASMNLTLTSHANSITDLQQQVSNLSVGPVL